MAQVCGGMAFAGSTTIVRRISEMAWKTLAPIFAAAWLVLSPLHCRAQNEDSLESISARRLSTHRFAYKIDPATSVNDLLPMPPSLPHPQTPWTVNHLSQSPEIFFQRPLQRKGRTINDILR